MSFPPFLLHWILICINIHQHSPYTILHLHIIQVNVVDAEELGASLKVDALPTLLFFKNGQQVGEFKGSDASKLEAAIRGL